MPLPESHFKSLEGLLQNHEEELAALHRSLQAFTVEIDRRKGGVKEERRVTHAKNGGVPVLISQRKVIERKITTHEALVALGRDRANLEVLGELMGNRSLAREAARDPRAFAKGRGIDIPASMVLKLDVNEDRVSLRITHNDEFVPFVLIWNSDQGFSVPTLYPRQDAKSAGEPCCGDA